MTYSIRNFQSIFILVILLLIILIVIQLNKQTLTNSNIKESNPQDKGPENNLNLNIIDLSKELEPALDYANISCKKSAKYVIETTLCIHDHNVDFISKFIWTNGVFEGHILGITNVNLIKKNDFKAKNL